MPTLTEAQKLALHGGPAVVESQDTPSSGPLHDLLQHYIEKAIKQAKRDPEYQAPKPKRMTRSSWEDPDPEEDWSREEEEYGEAMDEIVAAMCNWDKVFGPAVHAFLDEMEKRLQAAAKPDLIAVEDFMRDLGETDIPEALSAGFEKHFKVTVK